MPVGVDDRRDGAAGRGGVVEDGALMRGVAAGVDDDQACGGIDDDRVAVGLAAGFEAAGDERVARGRGAGGRGDQQG